MKYTLFFDGKPMADITRKGGPPTRPDDAWMAVAAKTGIRHVELHDECGNIVWSFDMNIKLWGNDDG